MSTTKAEILVYGASWCPDASRARQLLDRHRIGYRWIDIDEDAEAKGFVKKANQGAVILPTIVFPDGSMLAEPSNEELEAKLALSK